MRHSVVYYEENGEAWDDDTESYIECNWHYHDDGCGCCSRYGPIKEVDGELLQELERLQQWHTAEAQRYQDLIRKALEEGARIK